VRSGIDYGEIKVLVHVLPKVDVTYKFDSSSDNAMPVAQWYRFIFPCTVLCCRSTEEEIYPIQAIVRNLTLVGEFEPESVAVSLQSLFPTDRQCCLLTPSAYGCIGTVVFPGFSRLRLRFFASTNDTELTWMCKFVPEQTQVSTRVVLSCLSFKVPFSSILKKKYSTQFQPWLTCWASVLW
jgi:hypothetical protein